MQTLKCIGYHGTATENIESIQLNGYKMSNENSWFGRGVYFFEDWLPFISGEREAIHWMLYVKKYNSWAVFCATIESNNYLDTLGNIDDKTKYEALKNTLFFKHIEAGRLKSDFTDRIVFETLDQKWHFEAIRALVDPLKKTYFTYALSRPQVQICVKDLRVIVKNELLKTGIDHVDEE